MHHNSMGSHSLLHGWPYHFTIYPNTLTSKEVLSMLMHHAMKMHGDVQESSIY
jgi:hypothetical protein